MSVTFTLAGDEVDRLIAGAPGLRVGRGLKHDTDSAWTDGLNARMAGQPLASNPYRGKQNERLHRAWKDGWLEGEDAYGIEIRGRWACRPLCHADRRSVHQGLRRRQEGGSP